MKTRSLFGAVAVLAAAAMSPMPVQGAAADFCYGNQCFETLLEAEAALRASHAAGQFFQKVSEEVIQSGATRRLRMTYEIPDQPAEVFNPPGYQISGHTSHHGICEPVGVSGYETWCTEGDESALNMFERRKSPGCTYSSPEFVGLHLQPFYQVQNDPSTSDSRRGLLYYETSSNRRRLIFTVSCSGWSDPTPSPRSFRILKKSSFLCPVGTRYKIGHPPAHHPGNSTAIVHWPNVCRATGSTRTITATIRQVPSCAANGNPCHPATGAKTRYEPDFDFAGRPFVRHYNSLRQFGSESGFGMGWTTTYSARVGVIGALPYLITDEGSFVAFEVVAPDTYRPVGGGSLMLHQLPQGGHILYDETGEARHFDEQGRLIAIEDPRDVRRNIILRHEGERLVGMINHTGREISLHYDPFGRIAHIMLPDVKQITYSFDARSNLTEVTYPDESVRTYHYAEPGLASAQDYHALTGITAEGGQRYASFGYDSAGRVVSSALHGAGGQVATTTLEYLSNTEVAVDTEHGDRQFYTIEDGPLRRILSIENAQRILFESDFNSAGLLAGEYRAGVHHRYEYSGQRLAAVESGGRNETIRRREFDHDDLGRRVSEGVLSVAGDGDDTHVRTHTVFDGQDRVAAVCEVDETLPLTPALHCGAEPNSQAGFRQWRFEYCTSSQAQDPAAACPALALVRQMTAPGPVSDLITHYDYYVDTDESGCDGYDGPCHRRGDLRGTSNALGHRWEVQRYDRAGRAVRVLDANGVATELRYNWRGALVEARIEGGSPAQDLVHRFDYHPSGLLERLTQPGGEYIEATYDSALRLASLRDRLGNTIAYQRNVGGNPVREWISDAGGELYFEVFRAFNELGQLSSVADAGGNPTDYEYDAFGGVSRVVDALTRVSEYQRDVLGRVDTVVQDAAGIEATVSMGHDVLDRIVKLTDPKQLDTLYGFSGLGELSSLVSPDTGTTLADFGPSGAPVEKSDARGINTTYDYDVLGRIVGIESGEGEQGTVFGYDTPDPVCPAGERFSIGRLAYFENETGRTSLCYDRFGRLVRSTYNFGSVISSLTTRYQYDPSGNVTRLITPKDLEINYIRDPMGRTTSITVQRPRQAVAETVISGVTYAPFGPVTSMTYGNGRTVHRSYDLDYRPEAIHSQHVDGLHLSFTFDEVGNIDGITTGSDSIGYRYDGLNRLETVIGSDGRALRRYRYDATGNRTAVLASGGTDNYVYEPDSHRLLQATGFQRQYDASGNTTLLKGRTHHYDSRGRLAEVQQGSAMVASYGHNPLGQRVIKRATGKSDQRFAYDPEGRLQGEYVQLLMRLHREREYIWLDDLPVAVVSGASGAVSYIEADHLGAPRVVIDPVTEHAQWSWLGLEDPFGENAADGDPRGTGAVFELPLRFPGQYYDQETGLHYNYFRDYDPAVGRYVQSDPVGLVAGASTYAYVGGSPLRFIDSLGLLRIRAYVNRGGGFGNEWRYVFEFDPFSLNDIPGWGGKARRGVRWMGVAIDAMKPSSVGPIHPLRDYIECGELDGKIQAMYESEGYRHGQQLTRSQAENLLDSMYLAYPEMRRLYGNPGAILDNSESAGIGNWFNSLLDQAHPGEL